MRLRLYLDTSVVSAYLDERTPERRQATVEFWGRVADYDVAISALTVAEIEATGSPALRAQMLDLVRPFTVLPVGDDARRLAQEYIRRGVFSAATAEDATHVAVAVVSRQDMLVSWNVRHLVNRRRRALINETNTLLGIPDARDPGAPGGMRSRA
ncbi:MAG: PIN domain-containing protein [Candidatus Rokuibacteriota bacterium]